MLRSIFHRSVCVYMQHFQPDAFQARKQDRGMAKIRERPKFIDLHEGKLRLLSLNKEDEDP